jgi:uncharacterized membrane protein
MKGIDFENILLMLMLAIITCAVVKWRINYEIEQKAKKPEYIQVYNSEQAMIRLKHEKEKLDYGVITLERYNQIRDSLALIIK